MGALDGALPVLDQVDPLGKRELIGALVATLQHDRVVQRSEWELLRAVCARLHCPCPLLQA